MMVHWNLHKPIVIAHDFGGATTLRAHLLHACNFERFILMKVVAMRPWGSEFFDHVGKHFEAFDGLPPHIHRAIVEAYVQGALISQISADDFLQVTAPWLTENGSRSFYRQFAQADEKYTAEIEPMFSDIRCPVKIIWGEDDPWIPVARGHALNRKIGQDHIEILPHVGHLPQLEAPKQVLKAIFNFI